MRGKEVGFIQPLFNGNLASLFGIHFIGKGFTLPGVTDKRLIPDALAIDPSGHPVVIEYKAAQRPGVLEQIVAYKNALNLNRPLLESKSERPIDWSRLFLLCVAPDFNEFVVNAATGFNNANTTVKLVRYAILGEGDQDSAVQVDYVVGEPWAIPQARIETEGAPDTRPVPVQTRRWSLARALLNVVS